MSVEAIEIKKDRAIEAWQKGDQQIKNFLENLLGKKLFIPESIIDRVKTYEDACKELGVKSTDMRGWLHAVEKISVIAQALNEGWEPDWDNDSQLKWYPWFDMRKSSGGFSFDGCGYGRTYTIVGSRLCFKSEELAKYAGTQFVDLYKEFFKL